MPGLTCCCRVDHWSTVLLNYSHNYMPFAGFGLMHRRYGELESTKLETKGVSLDNDMKNCSSDSSTRVIRQSLCSTLSTQRQTMLDQVVSISHRELEQPNHIWTLSMLLPVIGGMPSLSVKLPHYHVFQQCHANLATNKSRTSATSVIKMPRPMMMLNSPVF